MKTERPIQVGGPIVTVTVNPALDVSVSTERVVPTEKVRCGEPQFHPGGGGINVARAIRALGGDALALFAFGGPTGDRLLALLNNEGVACRSIRIAGETREDFAVDELATGQQYRFILPGPVLAEEELVAILTALSDLRPRPAYIVASGSLPSGASTDFYCRVADIARAQGARLVLDCSGEALRKAARHGGIFLLKPSLREFVELTGCELPTRADQITAAKDLLGGGCVRCVVVSLGAQGVLLVTEDEVTEIPAIPVTVRSTIGAGDTMVAAIVFALTQGQSLRDSVRFATAAAAASLLRPGTQLCSRADVDRLYAAYPSRL